MSFPEIETDNQVTYRDGYRIEKLSDSVYAIDSEDFESMYLVKGKTGAALIDNGMRAGRIMPMIRELCELPVILLLTHGHSDHMLHADEFEEVYLHEADIKKWHRGLGFMAAVSSPDPLGFMKMSAKLKFKALTEGSIINLGDKKLIVIEAAGHAPGSVVFVDEEDKMVFTGDAIGSGSYAWTWMPFCSDAAEYMWSLERLQAKLLPYRDYRYLGGHRMQGYVSEEFPNARELSYELIEQMKELCMKLLRGELEPIEYQKQFGFTVGLYQWKDAAVVYRPKQLR